jgi:hypothetical protein
MFLTTSGRWNKLSGQVSPSPGAEIVDLPLLVQAGDIDFCRTSPPPPSGSGCSFSVFKAQLTEKSESMD